MKGPGHMDCWLSLIPFSHLPWAVGHRFTSLGGVLGFGEEMLQPSGSELSGVSVCLGRRRAAVPVAEQCLSSQVFLVAALGERAWLWGCSTSTEYQKGRELGGT